MPLSSFDYRDELMDLHGCNKTKMDEGCEDCGTPSRCCPLTRIHNEIAARQKEEARYVIRDSYDPRDDPDHICHLCFETDCIHCPRWNDA